MDLRLLAESPSDAERAAVDAVLGPPVSAWDGGPFDARSGRVAIGGRVQRERRHLLLPALHAVRDTTGWISVGGLGYICERLTIPPAEAFGVATFYALLGTEPRPERIIHACDDVVCGRRAATTDADTGATVVTSPCLGACDQAPAVLHDTAGMGFSTGTATPSTPQPKDGVRLLRRVGVVDPTSLDAYLSSGGGSGLRRARQLGAENLLAEIETSNLRGRGGAAFPVGAKWRGVRSAPGPVRYVIGNGDESEPGTFKDRVLMEADPCAVLEGLLVAAVATGATTAWLYVRAEYPVAVERLRTAAHAMAEAGMSEGVAIEIRVGAGAYVCGEETALFASIEGQRGEPRQKPPFPTTHGLFGRPTAINNIETLVAVLDVLDRGAATFSSVGTPGSAGPKLFSVSGDVAVPGVFEAPYGISLGELIDLAGGATGDIGAVLLGGAAGVFVGPDSLSLPLTLEDAAAVGATLGSGAVIVFDRSTDFGPVVRRIAAFFRDESCGKCVPCRVGTVRQEEALVRLTSGGVIGSVESELGILEDLDAVMTDSSICGLGRTASSAVRSAISLRLPGVIA